MQRVVPQAALSAKLSPLALDRQPARSSNAKDFPKALTAPCTHFSDHGRFYPGFRTTLATLPHCALVRVPPGVVMNYSPNATLSCRADRGRFCAPQSHANSRRTGAARASRDPKTQPCIRRPVIALSRRKWYLGRHDLREEPTPSTRPSPRGFSAPNVRVCNNQVYASANVGVYTAAVSVICGQNSPRAHWSLAPLQRRSAKIGHTHPRGSGTHPAAEALLRSRPAALRHIRSTRESRAERSALCVERVATGSSL
jgi:hypothetical protein